jgi:predicted nucleotidyltransferase
MSMNEAIREVLARLRQGLAQLYGDRLKGVYLFGSHARGEADEEYDIEPAIDNESASRTIEQAGEFLKTAREYLGMESLS